MDEIISLLKEINIAQIFAIFVGIWFFYSRLKNEMKEFDKRMTKFEENQHKLAMSIARIEGSLSTQGHCLFHQKNEKNTG